jgi:pimeloyl-ACP methyl ester carboxylesterase
MTEGQSIGTRRVVALIAAVLLTGCGTTTVASSAPSASATAGEPSAAASTPSGQPTAFDVTVGGIGIHGSCIGTRPAGAPVAVLSHGIGGDYTELEMMEGHLGERTMVCGYSRAGVGQSDPPADEPRPVSEVISEMHDVLVAAEIPPPYFLVGFSGGGSFVMMYAQAYPDDVVGFVSINPAPPYTYWTNLARDIWSPEEFQTNELDWYAGSNPEGIDMTGTDSMLTDPLPATMPYAVMFDDDCGGDASLCERLFPPLSATTELLAGVGEGGRFVAVPGAGHDIDLTEPQRVRETLDEIWDEATD